jgi:hypothetical protein
MKSEVIEVNNCRVCDSAELIPVLSLGDQYPNDFVTDETTVDEESKVPLDLVICGQPDCGLLQLKHTYSRVALYDNYWFRSSINETMIKALEDITENVESRGILKDNDIVLDIGCNDGTLLKSYRSDSLKLVGFEPSNLFEGDINEKSVIINDFFNYDSFQEKLGDTKCKVITSIAMFYDLEDPNKFVGDVAKCLDEDGMWVIQMAYLEPMINLNGFDNIVHEHVEYYSLFSLKNLLSRHNLEVFDVELNEIYGGSFRVFIKHKGNDKLKVQKSVAELDTKEEEYGFTSVQTYIDFADRCNGIKERLLTFLKEEISIGKKIYAYGASIKGNTTLQFFDIDSSLIPKVADIDENKFGKKTVGTNLEIISEEQAREENPDYFLVLPWHLIEPFSERESEYLKKGGQFIVPMPDLALVSKDGIKEI